MARSLKQRLILLLSLVCLVVSCLGPSSAQAATQPHGLAITPLRQYLKAVAGTTTNSSLTISNLTDKPLDVALSVRQFSLTDYTYNYQFTQPKNDWLRIHTPTVALQPQQTKAIGYELNIPPGTTPGGYYYTLLASANLANQGITSTIQAADVMYLTVQGKLIHTSEVRSSSISHFSFGRPFTYQLDVLNTGNVYFFAYTSGRLRGWSAKPALTASGHLLVPGAVRRLSGTISAPVLPGLYHAVYGYRTDSGQSVMRRSLVAFIPPWSIAFLLASILAAGTTIRRRRQRADKPPKSPTSTD